MITDNGSGLVALQGWTSSYIIDLFGGALPCLWHWGHRVDAPGGRRVTPQPMPYRVAADPANPAVQLESLPLEYGVHGSGDFRRPALHAVDGEGYPVTALRYREHRILDDVADPGDLPAVHAPAPGTGGQAGGDAGARGEAAVERLEIDLADDVSGLTVTLVYTHFPEYDVVVRHAVVCNAAGGADATGTELSAGSEGAARSAALVVDRVMSASVDLPAGPYGLLSLVGEWGWERQVERRGLGRGVLALESTRGISSHHTNPAFALASAGAGEEVGQVFGFALMYSGSWLAEVDASTRHYHRVNVGMNPFELRLRLEPGDSVATPQVILCASDSGVGGLSDRMHRFIEDCVVPAQWSRRARPVLLNSWEAQYFHIEQESLVSLAEVGRDLGVELFVVDDGWFGGRHDDTTSLGDWKENPQKLPDGLEGLAERIHGLGMQFGLWVEPEAVSRRSELFAAHPEWVLQIPGREMPEGRNQLVLDLAREDVQEWLIETLSELFERAAVDYVKWDMNRPLAPAVSAALPPERRGESAHRYLLGLYRVLRAVTGLFPDVLFEGCAGGGGRFDPGMLAFMPQIWTSDNTDAVARGRIQYGTSIFYPQSTMGAHVSAVPNHQLGRITPMHTRGLIAMSGVLGYELDLRALDDEERAAVRGQIDFYTRNREALQFGAFRRLYDPFGGGAARIASGASAAGLPDGYGGGPGVSIGSAGLAGATVGLGENQAAAWSIHAPDGGTVFVILLRMLAPGDRLPPRLLLRGLDPDAVYEDVEGEASYSGAELMTRGISLAPYGGDFDATLIELRRREG